MKFWNTGIQILYCFYCSIIALKCCVSFCYTTKWISYMHAYIPSVLDLPPTPIASLWVITEQQAKLLVPHSGFPLALYFKHGGVDISMLLSQLVPASPSPAASTRPFSVSPSLLVLCKYVHLYHFSRFHTYALTYDICFSLSDFTLHDRL